MIFHFSDCSSPVCFLLIEFNCIFSISRKMLPCYFYYYSSSPRSFSDGTKITLKCLDFFNLRKCSNYNIVHIVKYEY